MMIMTESAPTRLAGFLPYQLSITANAVSNLIAGEYHSRFGLKITEWRIMAILGDVKSAAQSELVGYTLMDKVTVNRACKALVERQLIMREPHGSDRRSHKLQLNDAGWALYNEIMPLAVEIERKLLAPLNPDDVRTATVILEKLRKTAERLSEQG